MIAEILHEGRENTMTAGELCALTGMNGTQLRLRIMAERRSGEPICSATGKNPGYFLAETAAEMREFCESMKHRIDEVSETRRACMEQIMNLPGADPAENETKEGARNGQ